MATRKRTRPVTLIDIAKACKVSRWTVAHALRGGSEVAKDTAERVHATARRLGYDPTMNAEARSLALRQFGRRASHRLIAVIYPAHIIDLPYYARILRGVFDACTARSYALVVNDVYKAPEALNETGGHSFGSLVGSGLIDGLLFHPFNTECAEAAISRLRGMAGFADRPVLGLMQGLPSCPAVGVDLAPALSALVGRMLDLGHRRILHLHQSPAEAQTVRDEMRLRGVDPARVLISQSADYGWLRPDLAVDRPWADPPPELTGVAEMRALLTAVDHPTAVLAANDACARLVWSVARTCGLHVPRNLSITGCDDTDPIPGPDGSNLLTSIRLPLEDVGRTAAEWIFARLAGEDVPVPAARSATPALRGSLGQAPSSTSSDSTNSNERRTICSDPPLWKKS